MRYHGKSLPSLFRNVPLREISRVFAAYRRSSGAIGGQSTVIVKSVPFPIQLRNGTSDFSVFVQVFLEEQYRNLSGRDTAVVLDLGANIGLSSLYFLSQFPQARIVAVEPDSDNLEMARANLCGYGDRVTLIAAAVWSHRCKLTIHQPTDGSYWATYVSEGANVGDCLAITIDEIMSDHGIDHIDILKIDIEGAEVALFSQGYLKWLKNTSTIAIELHSSGAHDAFLSAISRMPSSIGHQGEITVARFLVGL